MKQYFSTDIAEYGYKDVKMHTMIAARRFRFLLSVIAAIIIWASGCDKKPQDATTTAEKTEKQTVLSDVPLAPFQVELLELAFDTAAAIPVYPHIKDRSRTQEAVVTACLKLGQPSRALSYIEQISNWRQGTGYADLALYCAQLGFGQKARIYLDLANQIAEKSIQTDTADGNVPQEWRTDQIKVKIAQAYAWLGQIEQANQLEKGVVESETAKVAGAKALACDEKTFDEQVNSLETMIAQGNFDITKNALGAYAQLFKRFYPDEKRRLLIEEKIKASWGKMPIFIRIELLTDMAVSALEHNDQTKALSIVDEAQGLIDGNQWPVEIRIPMAANLVVLRFRAGDKEKAKSDADALLGQYETEGSAIVNIYRAGALRPLAEAYQAMGDREVALLVYKKAIKEGIENPNSRPRAEDLSATCCSMAMHVVEPDAELWLQIHQVRKGLGQPW